MDRDKEQKKAFLKYKDNNCVGSIIAGTGFGKTRVGVYAIVHGLMNSKQDALVLVPFRHLKENFKTEMIKTGYEEYIPRVQFECYASVDKVFHNAKSYSVLVCDEIHLGLTDRCFDLYKTFKFERKMFLTATLPENPFYKVRLHSICPPVYSISVDDCVIKGFVSPYIIKCVGVELTKAEKKSYKLVSANYGYWMNKMHCKNGSEAFSAAQFIMNNTKSQNKEAIEAASGFYRAIRQRKLLVDHAENKINVVKTFVNDIDRKLLVFGGDNKFTDRLASSIPGAGTYHSGKTKKVRDTALKDFKNSDVNVLCSTKALNHGLDVPDVSVGIICGLTSKALTMIQRVGRFIRIDSNDPDKKGEVIVLYVKNSQEEKWLKNALQKTDPDSVVWMEQKELLTIVG